MRRASKKSVAWEIVNELNPDIALLQEVISIPNKIKENFQYSLNKSIGKTSKYQKFGTAVLVNGEIINNFSLTSKYDWVNLELAKFSGNLSCFTVLPNNCPHINVISVYSPAWEINTSDYPNDDVQKVRLKQNNKIWLTEILWSGLQNENLIDQNWLIGGDFNCSETFDYTFSSGNKEILDRMDDLGLKECLREYNKQLVPTFKNPKGGEVIHQIDHLFSSPYLFSKLVDCSVDDKYQIFEKSISDHLPIIADFNLIPDNLKSFVESQNFIFAKTMPNIPHSYIVRDKLNMEDQELFDLFNKFIQENGYRKKFYLKEYLYFDIGEYKYWVIENILNRAKI